MFGCDPRAVVANAQNTVARLGDEGNLDLPADAPWVGGAIFNGVFDEVFGHPQQLVAVARDDGPGWNVELQDDIDYRWPWASTYRRYDEGS